MRTPYGALEVPVGVIAEAMTKKKNRHNLAINEP